jgi:hypothetical protein
MSPLARAALSALMVLVLPTAVAAAASAEAAPGQLLTPEEPLGPTPTPAPESPVTGREPVVRGASIVEPVRPPRARPAAAPTAVARRPSTVEVRRHPAVDLSRPNTAPRWHGEPITLSLRDAPLPEVLRTFAKVAGVNLILDPKVQGSVTVELQDVPWDQALYVILKTHGMAAEVDGRIWVVTPD